MKCNDCGAPIMLNNLTAGYTLAVSCSCGARYEVSANQTRPSNKSSTELADLKRYHRPGSY